MATRPSAEPKVKRKKHVDIHFILKVPVLLFISVLFFFRLGCFCNLRPITQRKVHTEFTAGPRVLRNLRSFRYNIGR